MTEPASGDSAVDRRVALAREWDELVAQVQKMEGFEDFLKPPKLRSLLPAADHGPVVIVNVTDWRSDALIVRPDGATSLRLESLTLHEATEWANGYLSVLRAAELVDLQHVQAHVPLPDATPRSAARRQLAASRELEKAHARVDEMLRKLQVWMWDVIAEPVLDALGFTCVPDGSTSTWPRVWWCPTGPLTLLPLHTAGHHRDLAGGRHAPRTVLDRVVSSYTPTLRALLEARRDDGDREATTEQDFDRLLIVDVPDLPGQVPIDNSAERTALFDAFPAGGRTVLGPDEASHAGVRAALTDHRWVHFSCHGDQDLKDPSRGGLLLSEGKLTVTDISTGRYHGDFAGLSACKTAVGGTDLPDEAITLAAALHYAGYRHVIAALWSVDNKASAEVFKYRTIAADGRLEPDEAPAALHEVVRRMRDRQPDWPHRWTPFTHTGP